MVDNVGEGATKMLMWVSMIDIMNKFVIVGKGVTVEIVDAKSK